MTLLSFFKNRKPRRRHETTHHVPGGMYRNAALLGDSDSPPDWIRIVPIGRFPDHPDGDHEVTGEHVAEMVANFERTATDLLVDLDHESLWSSTRAAGWIAGLEARDDGLYAQYPVFTPYGEPFIENREFRYLSPVYRLNTRDNAGNPIGARVYSVALTNAPYMDEGEIDFIGNSDDLTGEDSPGDPPIDNPAQTMDREKLTEKLGLKADATDEEIEAAIEALQAAQSNSGDEGEAGANPGGGSSEEDAPAGGDGEAGQAEIEALVNSAVEKRLKERGVPERAESLVDQAIGDGKIWPADRDVYVNSARHDYEATKKRLDGIEPGAAMPGKVKVNNRRGPGETHVISREEARDAKAYRNAKRLAEEQGKRLVIED